MNETRQQIGIPRSFHGGGKDGPAVPVPESGPGREGRLIDSFKYRVYLMVLPIGFVSTLLSWSAWRPTEQEGALAAVIDPALAALFAALFAVLLMGKERAVRAVEHVGYAGVVAYFVAVRYHVLYAGGLGAAPVDELSEVFSWTPVVYILAYLIFGLGRGLAISCAFYALFLVGGMPHLVQGLLEKGGSSAEFLAFVQFYMANAAVVILLYAFARFTGAYLEAHALGEAMGRLAGTDFVTGLPNRRHLYEALEGEISAASRGEQMLALLLCDLDRFKRINDSLGHDAGDRVLKEVARLARERLRASERIGRWGGEEFLILARGAGLNGGKAAAERIREAVGELDLDGIGRVTASFGVAAYRAGDTPETLLKRADEALYRAKSCGRNRVEAVG